MKSYYTAELNKLNETGRPFNRPLMWDFPLDSKTWELAENGIGESTPLTISADVASDPAAKHSEAEPCAGGR